jgi:xylulokinase
MQEATTLVFDVGTSSVKAVLFDRHGSVLAEREASYATRSAPGGREEQDPRDWWAASVDAARDLDLSRLECVSLAGTMQSVIPVGADGEPVRPALLYSDSRAGEIFARLAPAFERQAAAAVVGNQLNEYMAVFKMAWMRTHEPDRYRRTHVLHSGAKDYLSFKLTGRHATDPTAATTVGLMDIRSRAWSAALAELAEVQTALLPQIEPAGAQAGAITTHAARELGIRSGIPVINGVGDAGAATVGAGVSRPGEAYIYLGTSAWAALVCEVAPLRLPHAQYTLAHPEQGLAIRIGAMLCGGDSAAWFSDLTRETFASLERRLPGVDNDPPRVVFLPYLKGERCPFVDTRLRGAFLGVDRAHTAGELYYAVLEGVALALRANLDALDCVAGAIRLIGGGALSPMWPQLLADAAGRDVLVAHLPTAATALGAFQVSARHRGLGPQGSRDERLVRPRPERAARAEERRHLFNQLTAEARHWALRL